MPCQLLLFGKRGWSPMQNSKQSSVRWHITLSFCQGISLSDASFWDFYN